MMAEANALHPAMIRSALLISSALLLAAGLQIRPAQAQAAAPVEQRPDKYGGRPPIIDAERWPLTCTLNTHASTCRTEPNTTGGFTLFFSHAEGPIFDLTPVGPATTERRTMVDSTGTRWAMSGHKSFVLEEIGGFNNRISVGSPGSSPEAEKPWLNCLYNNKSIACRRTFLCPDAPCDRFRLEWNDGVNDTYTRIRDGAARNVGFYKDPLGGEWMLRGYAGSFALVNQANGNTIIYGMTLEECRNSAGLSDLCAP